MTLNDTPGRGLSQQSGHTTQDGTASGSAAASYSVLYAFGDSLTDTGNIYILTDGTTPFSPVYSDGRFSNGPVWVQDIASSLNLPAVTPSLSGGTDFAYGGAQTGGDPLHKAGTTDLPGQLSQFEKAVPHPSASALYALSIGGNDVIAAINEYATNPSAALADLQDAVGNEISFIGSLATLGAKNFIIMNVPDLGKTPDLAHDASTATTLSSFYDETLTSELSALAQKDHIHIDAVNAFKLIDQAVAHPANYGFKNVTTPVWTGNDSSPTSGTLNATGSAQNSYLFFDALHPTAAGHTLLANLALSHL